MLNFGNIGTTPDSCPELKDTFIAILLHRLGEIQAPTQITCMSRKKHKISYQSEHADFSGGERWDSGQKGTFY